MYNLNLSVDFLPTHKLSRVFVDDVEIKGINGGKAYESFGIGPEGAVIVVRPDGYIGSVLALDDVQGLSDYFGSFMS